MNKASLIQQLTQVESAGDVHVQTSSGIFVISAVQQGENGLIVLRATETAAGVAGQAEYQAQRKAAIAGQPEQPAAAPGAAPAPGVVRPAS